MAEPFNNKPIATMADVHIALKETEGDRAEAAKKLGLTTDQIHDFIANNDELKALWGKPGAWGNSYGTPQTPEAPGDIASLGRPPIDGPPTGHGGKILDQVLNPPEIPPDEKAIAEAMTAETFRLCRGLERIGLTEKEVGEAFGLAEFHGMHFKDSIGIIGGGMTRLSVKYQSVLNTLIQVRLPEIMKGLAEAGSDPEKRKQWIYEETRLYASLCDIGAECRKIMDVANRGALTQAVVRSRYSNYRAKDNMTMKKAKPSFNPGPPIDT